LKVLLLEPGKIARAAEIEHTLNSMQSVVGGIITVVYPFEAAVGVVANDEGLLLGLPLNRKLSEEVIIAGTCFICGLGEEDFTDLPNDLMERYRQQFYYPQVFAKIDDEIIGVPYDPEKV
jgi:hypothetical protein